MDIAKKNQLNMAESSSASSSSDEEADVEMDASHSEDWYDFALHDDAKKKRPRTSFHELISSKMDNNFHPNGNPHLTLEEKFKILKGIDIENIIKENVLPLLPAKVLTKFRAVSKQWDSWIKGHILSHRQSYSYLSTSGFFCQRVDHSPTFLSLHPPSLGIPTPALSFLPSAKPTVLASSHGLIVCRSQDTYYVCNPANETWRKLPGPEYYHGPNSAHALILDPRVQNIEGHYHLVCACSMVGQEVVCFEVYSSKTNKWRCSEAMCLDFEGVSFLAGPGFPMKGVAYWVTSMMQVVAFDLKNDVYEVMQLPAGECSSLGSLMCFDGELCYASVSAAVGEKHLLRLWYGVGLSRSREIEVELRADRGGFCRVLGCFEEDRMIMLHGGVLYSYSLVSRRLEVLRTGMWYVVATTDADANFLPYVNSLFRVV